MLSAAVVDAKQCTSGGQDSKQIISKVACLQLELELDQRMTSSWLGTLHTCVVYAPCSLDCTCRHEHSEYLTALLLESKSPVIIAVLQEDQVSILAHHSIKAFSSSAGCSAPYGIVDDVDLRVLLCEPV